MTWKEKRALAAAHFGLREADLVETVRVHKGTDHAVFPVYRCFRCGLNFSGMDCEHARLKQGRVVVVLDEVADV